MKDMVAFLERSLRTHADAEKAAQMAAYMKTAMPFYGVQKPLQRPIFRELATRFPPSDAADYAARVRAIWRLKHREEKYAAITYARRFKAFITPAAMPLYELLIREGAWWDLVDEVASHLVGEVYLRHRKQTEPILERWIADEDMWIRRAALLSQLRHKEGTDEERLFRWCRMLAPEKDFFIRKAVGWVLRQHAYVNPKGVLAFLDEMGDGLSRLSRKEAAKHL